MIYWVLKNVSTLLNSIEFSFSDFMLSLNVPHYSKSWSCSKSQMTIYYLLHVDKVLILGSELGFAEFGLLG